MKSWMGSENYRYCFVPSCTSTTIKNPNTFFVSVPSTPSVRKKWFSVVGRVEENVSSKTYFTCCEDHFDIEKDFSNVIRHQLTGCRLRLKEGVLPHIFKFPTATAVKGKRYFKAVLTKEEQNTALPKKKRKVLQSSNVSKLQHLDKKASKVPPAQKCPVQKAAKPTASTLSRKCTRKKEQKLSNSQTSTAPALWKRMKMQAKKDGHPVRVTQPSEVKEPATEPSKPRPIAPKMMVPLIITNMASMKTLSTSNALGAGSTPVLHVTTAAPNPCETIVPDVIIKQEKPDTPPPVQNTPHSETTLDVGSDEMRTSQGLKRKRVLWQSTKLIEQELQMSSDEHDLRMEVLQLDREIRLLQKWKLQQEILAAGFNLPPDHLS